MLFSGGCNHNMTAAATALVSSQREAERRLGLSHTALQKAQRAGRIAPEPGGGWDLETVRAARREQRPGTRADGDGRADAAHGGGT